MYVLMYVRTYVCMYVCTTYVHTYVCMCILFLLAIRLVLKHFKLDILWINLYVIYSTGGF